MTTSVLFAANQIQPVWFEWEVKNQLEVSQNSCGFKIYFYIRVNIERPSGIAKRLIWEMLVKLK